MKNLSLLTDFYEMTMMQGYIKSRIREKVCVFDMYFRENPCGNGYSIFAGLEQLIDYIENLRFSADDIE